MLIIHTQEKVSEGYQSLEAATAYNGRVLMKNRNEDFSCNYAHAVLFIHQRVRPRSRHREHLVGDGRARRNQREEVSTEIIIAILINISIERLNCI